MTFQPGSNNYCVAFGTNPENVEVPTVQNRAPATTDTNYPLGKRWVYIGTGEYTLNQLTSAGGILSATWVLLGTNGGALNTLTGDSGGAISPSAGNITLSGTASEITTTGSGSTIAFSLPTTMIVPGSLSATTTLTATLGAITATNGNLVLSTAGNKLVIAATSSATCSAGTFTLAGTATTVVSNSAVTANSLILLTTQALGTVSSASTLAVTAKSAGVSFTITPSQSTDTSTVAYLIIN